MEGDWDTSTGNHGEKVPPYASFSSSFCVYSSFCAGMLSGLPPSESPSSPIDLRCLKLSGAHNMVLFAALPTQASPLVAILHSSDKS